CRWDPWTQRVVPGGAWAVRCQGEPLDVLAGPLLRFAIDLFIQESLDRQAGHGTRPADVPQHDPQRLQRLAFPVLADIAEQAVLDGVPFGAPRRIVADRHGQPEGVTQLFLEGAPPGSDIAAVAPAPPTPHY